MLYLRMLRCFIVQGIGKALLWIALISGAGYAAYMSATKCPKDVTCVSERKTK